MQVDALIQALRSSRMQLYNSVGKARSRRPASADSCQQQQQQQPEPEQPELLLPGHQPRWGPNVIRRDPCSNPRGCPLSLGKSALGGSIGHPLLLGFFKCFPMGIKQANNTYVSPGR